MSGLEWLHGEEEKAGRAPEGKPGKRPDRDPRDAGSAALLACRGQTCRIVSFRLAEGPGRPAGRLVIGVHAGLRAGLLACPEPVTAVDDLALIEPDCNATAPLAQSWVRQLVDDRLLELRRGDGRQTVLGAQRVDAVEHH